MEPVENSHTPKEESAKSKPRVLAELAAQTAATLYTDRKAEAGSERKSIILRAIDRFAGKYLKAAEPAGRPELGEEAELMDDVEAIYGDVLLWHGTGRYQYGEQGEVVDAFSRIISQGTLEPRYDEIDFLAGKPDSTEDSHSVSLSPVRMYSRCYADLFQDRDAPRPYEYGSAGYWAKYFIGPIAIDGAIESKIWKSESRREIRGHIENPTFIDGVNAWRTKANKSPRKRASMWDTFEEGSDIAGNYPILIGLKEGYFDTVETSSSVARKERRTRDHIPLEAFTHIEVPQAYVAETRAILEEKGIIEVPVIPLEAGEYYASHFDLSDLIANKPLVRERKEG